MVAADTGLSQPSSGLNGPSMNMDDNMAGSDDILAAEPPQVTQARKRKEVQFKVSHGLLIACFTLFIVLHVLGVYLFTTGFLLTRLVLEHKSICAEPPVELSGGYEPGSSDRGCWHPKTFDKAVILLVDALRYDFTVPFIPNADNPNPHHFHDSIPFFYETSIATPSNAVLLPFIADPPTTTLQRLKGLTTGTLPTFIDAGSNFAGTSIDEDNLIDQFRAAGRNVVHLGDDTWHALFPGLFDANLTRPYDSLNVWDLHTVDNGVTEHLLPLLHPSNSTKWDILIGHFLGVDHAGHRYGPDHPAMTAKLQQMDGLFRRVVDLVDDKTLLVVMGDHGMDAKGDHGGESDDEVEAALWMYSKANRFGRTSKEALTPPPTAKIRPVNQIDLVPTLALLLGIPVPFNNLGAPIEEAFIGTSGKDWENLARVRRLSSARTRQYQEEYAAVRKPEAEAILAPNLAWDTAVTSWTDSSSIGSAFAGKDWQDLAKKFADYQDKNLRMCKDLWARFDVVSMALGIFILLVMLGVSVTYARSLRRDTSEISAALLVRGTIGLAAGSFFGFVLASLWKPLGVLRTSIASAAFGAILALIQQFWSIRQRIYSVLPTSIWSTLALASTLLLSIGFASNSYTIWEDETLLFFLAMFGTVMFSASLRLSNPLDRKLSVANSVLFMIFIRVASLSRLCREEQMPLCRTTFYASATSSTAAPWHLAISYLNALVLPSVVKTYYSRSHSYHGSAPFWVSIAFRACLFLIAAFWTLNAADDGNWLPNIGETSLKTTRMYIAQLVLMVAAGAGSATFAFQSPYLDISTVELPADSAPPRSSKTSKPAEPAPTKPQLVISGTSNVYGSHFTILPLTILLIPLLLVSKPMGQGVLALTAFAIFALLELLHLLSPANNTVRNINTSATATILGPVVLALLGHFAFFKTGHQAVLASIQWDSAFIAVKTVRYPWSPLLVALNTFAGQMLCAAAVPACVLWRRPYRFSDARLAADGASQLLPPGESDRHASRIRDLRDAERRQLLSDVAKALGTHFLVYAAINAATSVWAAHLRRHLMLYRVFSPRWMVGVAGLLVAELVGVFVGLMGVRWSVGSVAAVFGW